MLLLININIPFLSKFWHIKRVAGYLFCTGRNVTRIIISSISCHVRWCQIFPDITLNLVSYLYLLISNIHFLSKSWHIKRVSGYLFCTGRNVTHIIISSITSHVSWYEIFPDITLNLVICLYLSNLQNYVIWNEYFGWMIHWFDRVLRRIVKSSAMKLRKSLVSV